MKKLLLGLIVFSSGSLLGKYQGTLKEQIYLKGSELPLPQSGLKIEGFTHNVSPVKVHTGDKAPAIGAYAYAQGSSIYY